MTNREDYWLPEENLEFIAKDIGGQLLDDLTPEVRVKGLTAEERVKGLTLALRLIGLTPSEKKSLFERLAQKYGGNREASKMASGQYAQTILRTVFR